jgi:hypothetical protein
MSMPLELLIYIGLFALGLGLLGCFLGGAGDEKRKLRSAHEHRRYGPDPWDVHPDDGRDRRQR